MGCGRFTDHRGQPHPAGPGNVPDRADAEPVELRSRDLAHAPEGLDRQGVEECLLPVRFDHEQAIRFRRTARHLGQEFRPRHADRDRQPRFGEHPLPQGRGNLRRRTRDVLHAADLEEGLVDRDALDHRCRVVEDLVDRLAGLRVGLHPGRDHGSLGAGPARFAAVHGGVDPTGLGFVAGREDDARADDHRPAAQRRVVTLLDRRIEGVEVGVQDGRGGHEPMFAGSSVVMTGEILVTEISVIGTLNCYSD